VLLVAAVALTVVLRAGPDAPPVAQPSAEEEVEALLAATTSKSPPAEVLVVLEGPDAKLYRLEDATVRLDGAPFTLSPSAPARTSTKGTEVSDGDHVVSARLVYRGRPIGPYPWDEGPRWILPARVRLKAIHGLRLTVRLTVEDNTGAPTVSQRLGIRSEVEPEMLAVVDDAPLPPPPLPKLPPPSEALPASTTSNPPSALATVQPAAPPVAKKKKAKVARSPRPAPAVPASTAAPSLAPAATAAVPAAETLEQATARLRSALASPRDGGVAPSGDSTR
jgi:hypothetical protein